MTTIKSTASSLHRKLIPCVALAAASAMMAQTKIDPATSKPSPTAEEVLILSPFLVTDSSNSGYGSSRTMSGSRTSKALIELPTAISLINKEVIEDLGATDGHQLLRFAVSGVTQNQVIADDVNIRGFRSLGSLRNGIQMGSGTTPNKMYDIERVEVIKGPASMVLGGSSTAVGGAVNYITIKPSSIQSGYVDVTAGDNNYFRLSATGKGPLYKSKDFRADYRVSVGGLTSVLLRK